MNIFDRLSDMGSRMVAIAHRYDAYLKNPGGDIFLVTFWRYLDRLPQLRAQSVQRHRFGCYLKTNSVAIIYSKTKLIFITVVFWGTQEN